MSIDPDPFDRDFGRRSFTAEEPDVPPTRDHPAGAAAAHITALATELAGMKDRWIRAEAETANVRARAKREVDDATRFAVQKFASDVTEAAENLRRGLGCLPVASNAEPEGITRLRDGLVEVERNFIALLERNGIKMDDPTGSAFDPNLHQAMAEQVSVSVAPGTVLQAWTPTWTLNGRLLRPAMVVVSKSPATQATAAHPDRGRHTA